MEFACVRARALLAAHAAAAASAIPAGHAIHMAVNRSKAGEGIDLYRLLVENVRDYAIFVLDPRGYVSTWNLGAELIKGYRPEEIIGKHFSIFYPPDDIAIGKPQRALEIAAREGRYELEGWRVRKDGSLFWGDVIITALRDEDGRLVGFGKVTRDLTERRRADISLRQSEERFRVLVTNVRDYGIFMLDPRGIVASWNEGAERINGYKADEIIGRHFSTFYPSDDVKAGKPASELREALASGRFEDEGWRVRKDGSSFWASVIITALHDDSGRHIGFAKVTRDLTERRAAQERAIADARRVAQAEASSRAKSEFLAAMSHELRTPLNAIGGYGELLEIGVGGPVSEQQHEYLERIRRSQQHLLAIINNLLNFSRIEAGQVSYDIADVPMHAVVDRVLDLVAPQAERKNLDLEHGVCLEKDVARADQLKVEQIVLNLLSNAVKFTPAGGRVTASCGHVDGKACIQVRDTGPGVPPDKREAIFEPFVQLGRTLSSAHEGTGLGLAISRDLARAMGGDIQYETAPGGGAIFTLMLPRA